MPWFLGFLVIAISFAWWLTHWRAVRHWRRLEDVLSALTEGRKPDSLVFLNGGRFSQLAHPLENLSKEMDRLREEISREEFNLRAILSSMEEGVMVVDAHHILRLVNPSFLKLFRPEMRSERPDRAPHAAGNGFRGNGHASAEDKLAADGRRACDRAEAAAELRSLCGADARRGVRSMAPS
jgi:PAS domain-containing protein